MIGAVLLPIGTSSAAASVKLLAMSRWDQLIDEPRASILRMLLCDAAEIAHTENAARFDPEELGDDGLIYGLCTTTNARHVAARLIEEADLEGVAVCARGRVWWLEVERSDGTAVRVYLYKAPPGTHSVLDLRLDDTEIKKELSSANGRQMALFNRSGGEGHVDLRNVVVAHFGDHLAGLEKLDVGAPYLDASRGVVWDWHEPFSTSEATRSTDSAGLAALGDDEEGYPGLSLVSSRDEAGAGPLGPRPEEPEQVTSEFEALELKQEDMDENNGDAGTSQERR